MTWPTIAGKKQHAFSPSSNRVAASAMLFLSVGTTEARAAAALRCEMQKSGLGTDLLHLAGSGWVESRRT